MNRKIDELILIIRTLEEELEAELKKNRDEFQFIIDKKRVRFAEEVAKQQRRFKTGLLRYLIESCPLNVLTAPLIYAGFVPFILMDVFLTLYQTVCFTIYGIPRVKRSEYMVFDREDLPYLNIIEKFNCSYGNGLAAYFRGIAARTE